MGVSLKVSRQKVKKHPESDALLRWYDKHRRVLPWRAKKGEKADPYRVWLSEIMLQQTTVAAVGPYFQKFVSRWPTLNDLASADLDDVLRMWAGLGYYRRARMLYACAKKVREEFGGVFPKDEEGLKTLPGFGPYTAAAVASIAFGKCANVVDGNVERVIARIYSVREALPKAKKKLRALAAELVPATRCGDYAQALMDLGATVCTPRNPKCVLCPWMKDCRAKAEGIQENLPRRERKKAKPIRRAVAFVLVNKKDEVLLRKRPEKGLLAGMMEVPSSPWIEGASPTFVEASAYAPSKEKWKPCPGIVKHVFTHFTLEMKVFVAATNKKLAGRWVKLGELDREALPSLMMKIVKHAKKINHDVKAIPSYRKRLSRVV